MPMTYAKYTTKRPAPKKGRGAYLVLKAPFWRLATLAFRLPSPQLGLTAVFGKRTGVAPAINHQNGAFNDQFFLAVLRLETMEVPLRGLLMFTKSYTSENFKRVVV